MAIGVKQLEFILTLSEYCWSHVGNNVGGWSCLECLKEKMQQASVYMLRPGFAQPQHISVHCGFASSGELVFVLADVFEMNRGAGDDDADTWLDSADGENVWVHEDDHLIERKGYGLVHWL